MDYIISDLHFTHKNSIKFDKRPFESIQEMNKRLIKNWNNKVQPDDTVYVLGDMFYRAKNEEIEEITNQLNGGIIYIWGNHEKGLKSNQRLVRDKFKETHTYLEMPYTFNQTKYRLVMNHYPIPMFNGHFGQHTIHFYGHVHTTEEQLLTVYQQLMNFTNSNRKESHLMLNVGAMMSWMNYEPKRLTDAMGKAISQTDKLYTYFNKECKGQLPTLEEFRKQEHLYLY